MFSFSELHLPPCKRKKGDRLNEKLNWVAIFLAITLKNPFRRSIIQSQMTLTLFRKATQIKHIYLFIVNYVPSLYRKCWPINNYEALQEKRNANQISVEILHLRLVTLYYASTNTPLTTDATDLDDRTTDLRTVIMMLKSIKKFSEQRKFENSRQKNIF